MARAIKHVKGGLLNFEIIGTIPESSTGRRRGGRCRPTCTAQQFYNDKCSWRELALILGANFGRGDYVVTFTYGANLPLGKSEADKCFKKFIRKLRAVRRKRGQELRYVYVTEGVHGKAEDEYFGGDGGLEDKRLHHHAVFNGVGPDDLEEFQSLWLGDRHSASPNDRSSGLRPLCGGYLRIEPVDVHYYRELAKYLTKEPREFGRVRPGEHAWRASRNLRKYEVEYIEIPSDSVTLSAPPGAVDYVQFNERNPYGFGDCVGAWYLLFEEEPPPEYSYTKGRKRNRT